MVDIMRDNVLIGREDVMHFLTEKLSSEGHNRVALVALGGTGYDQPFSSQSWMLTLH
jgi:hypothetical protein